MGRGASALSFARNVPSCSMGRTVAHTLGHLGRFGGRERLLLEMSWRLRVSCFTRAFSSRQCLHKHTPSSSSDSTDVARLLTSCAAEADVNFCRTTPLPPLLRALQIFESPRAMFTFMHSVRPQARHRVAKNAAVPYICPSITKPHFIARSKSATTPLRPHLRLRRLTRHGPCRAETKSRATEGRDPAAHCGEFVKLLESGQTMSETWLGGLRHHGRHLVSIVEELQATMTDKTSELGILEEQLTKTSALLNEAREQQSKTEAQLERRSQEVHGLKEEMQRLQHDRDADVTTSMERFRELEDALAHAESELRSHSESFQSREGSGPVDVGKLSEIVKQQDAVLQNVSTSLKQAMEEKVKAKEAAQEAKRRADEIERTHKQLQQDQELLAKELSQLQILYAEKELEWTNDVQTIRQEREKLKEESVGLEFALVTKERKLNTLTSSFESMKSNLDETQRRLAELKRECAELKSINVMLEEQLKNRGGTADQHAFMHVKTQLTRFQVRVPVLEAEIDEMTEQRKKIEQQYQSMEKDFARSERKCQQLEQRAATLQGSMEEKSNRLMAWHKEKRTLKAEADRQQREAASLNQQRMALEKEMEKLKAQLQRGEEEKRENQRQYHEELLSIVKHQQEAQRIIVYHQEHKNENRELKTAVNDLTQQLEAKKSEMEQLLNAKTQEIEEIRTQLTEAKDTIKTKEVDILAAQEEYENLKSKLDTLKDSSDASQQERITEIAVLKRELQQSNEGVQTAANEVQNIKKEMAKLQNELSQRQRIISVRDQEILTLKDDARLANERVEALRGQVTSMQTLNREMEVEMAETDNVVTQMNAQLHELKSECEEKQKSIDTLTKTVTDLESKGKQSMDQFSKQIESLEEYSKQQEGLVESFFEEKQALEVKVSDLESQLADETEKVKASQDRYEQSEAECHQLKAQLQQAAMDVETAKESAAEEIKEAAKILAKAESMAESVQENLAEEESSMELNGAASREMELLERIASLEAELQREQESSCAALSLSAKLEAEMVILKQQISDLKEAEQQDKTVPDTTAQNELIAMSKRLSQSLAAEESALSEIQRLRAQLKALEIERSAPSSLDVSSSLHGDERYNHLRRHADRLEEENEKLKKAAHKRNQILAQSRLFIEQYLDGPINSVHDMQS